ncbi:MAG: hypothetical protein KIT79_09985 [Deltaproteobacteria bacterium]|nr:hypothetical protein [Deltaproteobacteria bacterium]
MDADENRYFQLVWAQVGHIETGRARSLVSAQKEPLYLAKYIERMGTGTGDMIRRCREAGFPEPEFTIRDGFVTIIRRRTGQVTGQVDPWVERVLEACAVKSLSSKQIQEISGIRHRESFQRNYLDHLLNEGWLERTIPDKPNSSRQQYRLTGKGSALLAMLREKNRRE